MNTLTPNLHQASHLKLGSNTNIRSAQNNPSVNNFDNNGKIVIPPPPLTDEQILKTGFFLSNTRYRSHQIQTRGNQQDWACIPHG